MAEIELDGDVDDAPLLVEPPAFAPPPRPVLQREMTRRRLGGARMTAAEAEARLREMEELDAQTYYEVRQPILAAPSRAGLVAGYADWVLFTALLAVGLAMTASAVAEWSWTCDMGEMLVESGLLPLVISLWAVAVGAGNEFRRHNLIKAATAAAVLAAGVALLSQRSGPCDDDSANPGADELVGKSLFAAGVFFLISKFFMLEEDTSLRIDRLERQLAEAVASPARGLALSYFYNFVVPTAANLRRAGEGGGDGSTPVRWEVARGQFEPRRLVTSRLLLLVPRGLAPGDDLKGALSSLARSGAAGQGQPVPREGDSTHRPMFCYFLRSSPDSAECDLLFDLPTIVSSIAQRAEDERSLPAGERPALPVDVGREIREVQNHLVTLVAGHESTRGGVVRVLSIPPLPLRPDALRSVCERVLRS